MDPFSSTSGAHVGAPLDRPATAPVSARTADPPTTDDSSHARFIGDWTPTASDGSVPSVADLLERIEARYREGQQEAEARGRNEARAERERAESDRRQALERAEAAEATLRALGDIEERVGRLVVAAQTEAEQSTTEAERRHAELQRDAARRVADAEAHVGRILSQAEEQAREITRRAELEGERLRHEGIAWGLDFIDGLQDHVARMRDAQLADLRAARFLLDGIVVLAGQLRSADGSGAPSHQSDTRPAPSAPVATGGPETTNPQGAAPPDNASSTSDQQIWARPSAALPFDPQPPNHGPDDIPTVLRRPSPFRTAPNVTKPNPVIGKPTPGIGKARRPDRRERDADDGNHEPPVDATKRPPPPATDAPADIFASERQSWDLDDLADLRLAVGPQPDDEPLWPPLAVDSAMMNARDFARISSEPRRGQRNGKGWGLRRHSA